MEYKKPSYIKICHYAILKVLAESNEPKYFNDLVEYTGFEPKYIVSALKRCYRQDEISKVVRKKTEYTITKQGLKKLKVYDEKMNLGNYWTPPWEE